MAEPPIKSALESPQFTTDVTPQTRARLAACLASDGANIRPYSPAGPHITAIQAALKLIRERKLPDLPAITDPDGTYGDTTAAAVKRYKEINAIQRSYQPQVDAIVGRMTITRLDNELKNLSQPGPNPNPSPNPQPTPAGSWTWVVPTLPFLIKEGNDDPAKADLDVTQTSLFATMKANRLVDPLAGVPSVEQAESRLNFFTGLGGPESQAMATRFFANTARAKVFTFPEGHFWSKQMKGDVSGFQFHDAALRSKIASAIQAGSADLTRTVDLAGLVMGPGQNHDLEQHAVEIGFSFKKEPFRATKGDPMAFGFGAIQGLKVWLIDFKGEQNGRYRGTLKYEVIDHYGSDNDDWSDPGQAALYLLQRGLVSGQDKTRYKPYIGVIQAEIAFDGLVGAVETTRIELPLSLRRITARPNTMLSRRVVA